MANCAIYIKGSDEINYFIRDCIQTGRDFKGSNGGAYGVKAHLFDVKWTDGLSEPGNSVAALSEAKRYQGKVVSTKEDVNSVTRDLISERYSLSDENKLMRLKLSGDDTGWNEYQEYVDSLVKQGKAFKEENFKEA